MLRILIIHNKYQEPGGEDVSAEAEARLLAQNGDQVIRYERSNDELGRKRNFASLGAGIAAVWSNSSYRAIRDILKDERPDLAHFHNTFPLISPSAYYACAEAGVPVVQTLHNYRLLCPAATFLRDGKVCESCLGRAVAWSGVLHGCYRDSRSATLATAAMLSVHRAANTWSKKVNVYIALTEFARGKYIAGGIPADRIVVKPNFVADPPNRRGPRSDHALFVGRLSIEKGPQFFPEAWQSMQEQIPLRVVGDGPLMVQLREVVERMMQVPHIELMGRRAWDEVARLMGSARFLIVPSVWYEPFGRTVIEAYSCGLPVIASRIGSLAEIVHDGVTGLHFNPGDAMDLAAKVEWAWNHPDAMAEMGRAARREYEAKYTPERNYQMLMDIYRRAIASQAQQVRAGVARAEVTEN